MTFSEIIYSIAKYYRDFANKKNVLVARLPISWQVILAYPFNYDFI